MGKNNKLNIDLFGIASLLSGNRKLTVPKFQREYSWDEGHVKTLLQDIFQAYDESQDEYFLGTFVLTTENDIPIIVDGQQRLATTAIILAVIRDIFKETNDADNNERAILIEKKYLFSTVIKTLETQPHLILNENDNDFFISFILERNVPTKIEKASHKRIASTYNIVKKLLNERIKTESKPDDFLGEIIEYLTEKARVIVLEAPSESNAYILFETLNDRGLELALSDLLKNYLFSRADKRLEEARAHWLNMMGVLEAAGEEDLAVSYIRHLWNSEKGLTREKVLYEAVKKEVRGMPQVITFTKKLSESAKTYIALINANHEFWDKYGDKTRHHIKTLNMMDLKQPRPLILAVLRFFSDSEIKKAIKLIIAWSVRFTITGKLGGGAIETAYANLAAQISSKKVKTAKEMIKHMNIVPSDADFEDAFAKARVTKAILARYYLIELEKYHLNKDNLESVPNDDPEEVSLEHVLPQTMSPSWATNFSEESHKEYYKRLGNLAILGKKLNNTAGSDSFDKKKILLSKSKFTLTKTIAKKRKWTVAEIATRQKELAADAIKLWANKVS